MSHLDMPGDPLPLRWRLVKFGLLTLGCAVVWRVVGYNGTKFTSEPF